MTFKPGIAAVLMFVGGSCYASAANRYNPELLCPANPSVAECDRLVEQAVAQDVPGVIERQGPLLKLHAANGKTVEWRNADPAGEQQQTAWACDYVAAFGFIRVCHRLLEASATEFVNIRTGDSLHLKGWPIHSPSGKRMLIVDGYDDAIFSLEIWRFEAGRLVREFRTESPAGQGWETASWINEREIAPQQEAGYANPQYVLQNRGGWKIHRR